jgi:hypothetical protein
MQLWSKTWNQVDTYKQVLLSEHAHENDPYLVVCCPQTRSPKIFKQKVLPFGLVASVTVFCHKTSPACVDVIFWRLLLNGGRADH